MNEQIFWLDVSVNYSEAVKIVESICEIVCKLTRLFLTMDFWKKYVEELQITLETA